MNNFYIDKVARIRAGLPPTETDPLETLRFMMQGCQSEFSLQPVHPDSVEKTISSLKNTSSCGLVNIDTRILKLVKTEVVPPITHIVNLSISEAVYPKMYKISKIIPLYKGKGDSMEPGNFRPVALLPIVSKYVEWVVYQQILK